MLFTNLWIQSQSHLFNGSALQGYFHAGAGEQLAPTLELRGTIHVERVHHHKPMEKLPFSAHFEQFEVKLRF